MDRQVRQLTTYAIVGADGLFVANEIEGDAVDLVALFELHAKAIHAMAVGLADGTFGTP